MEEREQSPRTRGQSVWNVPLVATRCCTALSARFCERFTAIRPVCVLADHAALSYTGQGRLQEVQQTLWNGHTACAFPEEARQFRPHSYRVNRPNAGKVNDKRIAVHCTFKQVTHPSKHIFLQAICPWHYHHQEEPDTA